MTLTSIRRELFRVKPPGEFLKGMGPILLTSRRCLGTGGNKRSEKRSERNLSLARPLPQLSGASCSPRWDVGFEKAPGESSPVCCTLTGLPWALTKGWPWMGHHTQAAGWVQAVTSSSRLLRFCPPTSGSKHPLPSLPARSPPSPHRVKPQTYLLEFGVLGHHFLGMGVGKRSERKNRKS